MRGFSWIASSILTTVLTLTGTSAGIAQNAEVASESEPGVCKTECAQARRACRRGAYLAWRSCRRGCFDAHQQAVRRTLAACRDEGLTPEECAPLVREATTAAAQVCYADCRKAKQLAHKVCAKQIGECARACAADLDPVCARTCGEEFQSCAGDMQTCHGDCRQQAAEDLRVCQELSGDPDQVRECVMSAQREALACHALCAEELACGPELRACLTECPPAN